MLYKRRREKQLDEELFRNPGCEYRDAPFWAWNCRLNRENLMKQIETMKLMGMGGFHIHVRTGMDSPYLDEEFMEFVKACLEKGQEKKMLTWLYDEDRWPSGTAGGKVTKEHPEYAAKSLLLTTRPYPEGENQEKGSIAGRGKGGIRQENGILLAVYDIVLDQNGKLLQYRMIKKDQNTAGIKWYAYLEHGIADPWFNDAPYVDTLNAKAIQRFIEITHKRYREKFGGEFGKWIPGIFTDEPQFNKKSTLNFPEEEKDVFLPWTDDLEDTYRKTYQEELLPGVPELLWELPDGKISRLRYRYHNHVADRFAESYCRQIGEWCCENGIALTGHLPGEGALNSQTQVIGDAMRCYRYFQIPGIDILCDRHEYTTAKQTQSIVHQMGAEAMLSELYGVTGWDCDFRTYKMQGDWQAALGVTVRVPHLFWMSMKGEAKRDYPASIGYQSPWYTQYRMIEDHFARLNTALTRGKPVVKIGVIHPIESYWLHFGPVEQTNAIRDRMEKQFHELAEILLFHGMDFDYICENELPYFCPQGGNPLKVGEMSYEVIIVSGCETLRRTTLERLIKFSDEGGCLIVIGDRPKYLDAEPSCELEQLSQKGKVIAFNETTILENLEPYRFLEIRREDGRSEDRILHQLRKDGEDLWLFLATGKNPECQDIDDGVDVRLGLKGAWKVTLYDTLTGKICSLPAKYANGKTVMERKWHIHDSLLLKLEKGYEQKNEIVTEEHETYSYSSHVLGTVAVTLTEPNMLLLDMAEYALDGGKYMPEEEILRIDNAARKKLGIPLRRKEVTQPYLIEPEEISHHLHLRFRIYNEIEGIQTELALEDLDKTQIWLNGDGVEGRACGWYVDQSIQKTALPGLKAGENILEIKVPVGKRTNLENYYLLGDFGVRIKGTEKTLVSPVKRLGFGDITRQGLPFYTGNLFYHFRIMAERGVKIRIPRYRGALMKVYADGKESGRVAFSPYEIELRELSPGEHEIAIELFGTRQNGFGQLHHTPGLWFYQSPNSWRSTGLRWSYEYQLKEAGILRSPEIYGGYWIPED